MPCANPSCALAHVAAEQGHPMWRLALCAACLRAEIRRLMLAHDGIDPRLVQVSDAGYVLVDGP